MSTIEGSSGRESRVSRELSSVLREAVLLRESGLEYAFGAEEWNFAEQGMRIRYVKEVAVSHKETIRDALKTHPLFHGAETFQLSERHTLFGPRVSLVLERPFAKISHIRKSTRPRQRSEAYVVTARANGSLVFEIQQRLRYLDTNDYVVLPSPNQELLLLKPLEIIPDRIQEGLALLFPKPE